MESKYPMPSYIQNNPSTPITDPKSRVVVGAAKQSGIAPVAAHLGLTLDASISMRPLVDAAIGAVNTLLREQKELNPASRFSLSSFGDRVRPILANVSLADAPTIDRSLYVANGSSTVLNDAILDTISQIGKQVSRSTPVLIGILTDGCENSSRASLEDVFSVVTYRRTTYRWQFIFIGPPEAEWYALRIGIAKSNVISFTTDPAGIRSIIARLSQSMAAYQLGDPRYVLKLRN